METVTRIETLTAPPTVEVGTSENVVLVEEGWKGLRGSHATSMKVHERGTVFLCLNLVVANEFARTVHIVLESGARASLVAIIHGTGAGSCQLTIDIEHRDGASTSRVGVLSILAGRSRLNLGGHIAMRQNANRSDAHLRSRTVLLGSAARSHVIPSFIIEARDVRASHAAATGPLDVEQLFYLESRGFSADDARIAILRGMLRTMVDQVPAPQEQDRLRQLWDAVLAAPPEVPSSRSSHETLAATPHPRYATMGRSQKS